MTTDNQSAGLAAMFERYASLSLYFYRHATPPDLATREFQERLRLEIDLKEQIKRLVAFASHQASQVADTAEPRASQGIPDDCYYLAAGEMVQPNDEYKSRMTGTWHPTLSAGFRVDLDDIGLYRRRIAKPEPQYRMLEAGERVLAGDEWHEPHTNEWKRCVGGSLVGISDVGDFRRPIPAPVAPEAGLAADFQPETPKAEIRSDGGAAKGSKPVFPDREHIVDIPAHAMRDFCRWIQHPNGAHRIGRVCFEAVASGAIMVRTQLYA